jgi:hypothetical protein
MLTNETMIELHSESCRCHGYGWNARRKGATVRTACCIDGEAAPSGCVWVDSAQWLALGMPRTTEQYYRVLSERKDLPVAIGA